MRNLLFLFTLLLTINSFAQEKSHDVRRTLGINFPTSPSSTERKYYLQKFGFIYRQCYGKYVLQAELDKMRQHSGYGYNDNNIVNDTNSLSYSYNYNIGHRSMKTLQLSLLKGWTNDLTNIYVGFGIRQGLINENGSYSRTYYTNHVDSTGNYYITYNNENYFVENWKPRYFMFALTCTAALEFRITKSLTGLVKYNPMFSWNWRLSKGSAENENLQPSYKNHYKQMTHSGIEISVNYKL